jgi:glycerate 2-kinase
VTAVDAARLTTTALESARLRAVLSRAPAVVAAGKAALPMIAAAARAYPPGRAVVATRIDGPVPPMPGVEWFDAGHPAPNRGSVDAAVRALALAREASAEGGLLVLLSGGASAMLAAPADGLTLADKVETARTLMAAGAAIDELNCVRKHLSRSKGGRLAAAAGRVVTLALSDVHAPMADDPSVIGSGPTVPDPTTFADALDVIRSRRAEVPRSVLAHLGRGARGEADETLKPGDPRIVESAYEVIGNRHTAMAGAMDAARARGFTVVTIDTVVAGEAREAARAFLEEAGRRTADVRRPLCIIASGETTVTVRGRGLGGRNQEFALAAALALGGFPAPPGSSVLVASAGTDGIDGPTDAAGALADRTTMARSARQGLDATAALHDNDAYRFFEPLGDLIRWGPTGTNVGDLHVLLIG